MKRMASAPKIKDAVDLTVAKINTTNSTVNYLVVTTRVARIWGSVNSVVPVEKVKQRFVVILIPIHLHLLERP